MFVKNINGKVFPLKKLEPLSASDGTNRAIIELSEDGTKVTVKIPSDDEAMVVSYGRGYKIKTRRSVTISKGKFMILDESTGGTVVFWWIEPIPVDSTADTKLGIKLKDKDFV